MDSKETILREINVIDDALVIIAERPIDDRIADALLREIMDCTNYIKELIAQQ